MFGNLFIVLWSCIWLIICKSFNVTSLESAQLEICRWNDIKYINKWYTIFVGDTALWLNMAYCMTNGAPELFTTPDYHLCVPLSVDTRSCSRDRAITWDTIIPHSKGLPNAIEITLCKSCYWDFGRHYENICVYCTVSVNAVCSLISNDCPKLGPVNPHYFLLICDIHDIWIE